MMGRNQMSPNTPGQGIGIGANESSALTPDGLAANWATEDGGDWQTEDGGLWLLEE
jgi:hypothetical protein